MQKHLHKGGAQIHESHKDSPCGQACICFWAWNCGTIQYQPLDRMRIVVLAVRRMMEAELPGNNWQIAFTAYRLPSPWTANSFPDWSEAERAAEKHKIQAQLQDIWKQALLDVNLCWEEFLEMLPAAESNRRSGCSVSQAFAKASAEFPEKENFRAAVNELLSFVYSTGEVERSLKFIPYQERQQRAHMLGATLEQLVLVMQAPIEADIAERQNGQIVPRNDYLPDICRRYVNNYGFKLPSAQASRQKRNAGIKVDPELLRKKRKSRGAPVSEAEPQVC